MAGKDRDCKCPEPEVGAPLWMVTYSDMVTLLLCFFVMQLSMANFLDPGKVEAALESIHAAFSTGGTLRSDKVIKTQASNSDQKESAAESLHNMVSELRDVMSQSLSNDMIRMTQKKTEVRLRIDSSMLFQAGAAELHPSAYKAITDIATALEGEQVNVIVEGHADADGTDEIRNWNLSAERAVTVVNELRKRKGRDGLPIIEGKYIAAKGMGEFRPAEYKEGSSRWNRRVEIVIRGRSASAQKAVYKVESSLD